MFLQTLGTHCRIYKFYRSRTRRSLWELLDDCKQGAFTIGLAINSVSSIPKDTDNALGEWLTNFGSLENIEKHSRRDVREFLKDNAGCESKQNSQLEDGIESFYSTIKYICIVHKSYRV